MNWREKAKYSTFLEVQKNTQAMCAVEYLLKTAPLKSRGPPGWSPFLTPLVWKLQDDQASEVPRLQLNGWTSCPGTPTQDEATGRTWHQGHLRTSHPHPTTPQQVISTCFWPLLLTLPGSMARCYTDGATTVTTVMGPAVWSMRSQWEDPNSKLSWTRSVVLCLFYSLRNIRTKLSSFFSPEASRC